jgi:hypothetical protein
MPTYTIRNLHAEAPDGYQPELYDILEDDKGHRSYSDEVYDTLAEAEAAKALHEAGEPFVGTLFWTS